MEVRQGQTVYMRLLPEMTQHTGAVVRSDEETIQVRPLGSDRPLFSAGQYVVITDGDLYCYTEVTEAARETVVLKRLWEEKREYFRVDDRMPLTCRKVDKSAVQKACLFTGYQDEALDADMPEDPAQKGLWKVLVAINAKLGLILDKLTIENEGLTRAEVREVNISASGIKVPSTERLVAGDKVELKMLLPTSPPTGVLCYGTVVRVSESGSGEAVVSVSFIDPGEEITEKIVQYTLNRQREIIRQQRKAAKGN
jgi:hypothetical protein